MPQPGKYHLSPSWALEQLPGDQGEPFRVVLEHGSLEIEGYSPQGHDPQQPHPNPNPNPNPNANETID